MLNADSLSPISEAEADALFADLTSLPRLVIAVSGGPDSTALLFLLARWRSAREPGPTLSAVTIDHALRPESASEAAAVRQLCGRIGVRHRILRWNGPKPATGLQQAARNARYRLLARAAREADATHIALAHTLDDQAETVLLRLARGSGLTGLAGMGRMTRLGDLTLVRPLLKQPKAKLVATLRAAKIPFAADPSNDNPRFTRVRWRKLMPALAAEGLDAARLCLFAHRLARADAALDAAATEAARRLSVDAPGHSAAVAFDAAAFATLPAEIALRLVQRTIARIGDEGPVELGKVETLVAALIGAVEEAPSGPRLRRTLAGAIVTLRGGRVLIERAPARRYRIAAATTRLGRKRSARRRSTGPFTTPR